MPNRKGWFAIFFIISTLAIPFGITYYASTDTFKERYQESRKQSEQAGIPSHSKITSKDVLMVKNKKIIIDRTGLVYRGIQDKKIIIDLFLLDLDPEQGYRRIISKKEIQVPIKLGNILYQINSANKHYLKLKILQQHLTP